MGTLSYFAKDDGELFALNKVYHYADEGALFDAFDSPARLADVAPDESAFVARFLTTSNREWAARIYARLRAWAGNAPISLTNEYDENPPFYREDETYEQHKARITGSAHDSDYEDDGVTYIAGAGF